MKPSVQKTIKAVVMIVCAAAVAASALGLTIADPTLQNSSSFSPNPIPSSVEIANGSVYDSSASNNTDEESDDEEKEDSTENDDNESSDSSQLSEEQTSGNGEKSNISSNLYKTDNISNSNTSVSSNQENVYDNLTSDDITESNEEKSDSTDNSSEGISSSDASESSDSDDTTSSIDSSSTVDKQEGSGASQTDSPGERTQDGTETNRQLFETSIVDGESVTEAQFFFSITHLDESLTVKSIEITLNGDIVLWNGSVMLSSENKGINKLRVSVTYSDDNGEVISGYREYTIYLISDESQDDTIEPVIVTDLSNHTRSDSNLEFFAYISGNVTNVSIKVYLGSKRIYEADGEYSCTLSMGSNLIRIKASCEYNGETIELYDEYKVKLIAETTDETAPYLSYQNVPSSVKGSTYLLNLMACDYTGATLNYSNMYLSLNGSEISYSFSGEYITYKLSLLGGQNTLNIRVTDDDGRYTDYSYVISCTAASDGELLGYALLDVDASVLGLGDILSQTQIEIREGESAAASILRALEDNGFTVDGVGEVNSGYYISRIYKDGITENAKIESSLIDAIVADSQTSINSQSDLNSLGEFDFTNSSGWMISVNGIYTSYGLSEIYLTENDIVRIRFTLANGKDIGAGANGDSYEVTY